ncbi:MULTISPECIES: type II toxin-antitoxin system TacA family antitoxin [unclassified Pseudomonas]|uniref:type II toxin-antitoxin system TacA family antitoxin n=1 Tax=unclassified Pseudomonas TaxID=196821 RepID=UPI000C86AF7C|nr:MULTISPECIES: DUF1778 domain-containing protein [unclassified Pseudomonas]PMV25238.1 hypothetical protein C1X17_05835 [Pseudomonas sp. FW305-3-2-15-C-TSA2]PMV28960.1 hypothetical protein C1X22_12335 [Pseudomonas sp. DP16D-L5]PMV38955.1 hypothetical protein C1X21_12450 [Pseudomonas sp. FW305-3-2-15-A-LB2]PMV40990.1 hypothetical protein C1X16_25105 [Pseudomonas sp. FW305-3-2-15-C-R2A1]PMV50134.1 hypothetical protein C1X19_26990 [Pseudomonas sp. GW460-4]
MANTTPSSSQVILHIPPQQLATLRRAAELTHTSLANFILDSACRIAKQALMDPASPLERDLQGNPGVEDLLSRPAPWNN